MKTFIKSIRFTIVIAVYLSVAYILFLWVFAKVAGSNSGSPEMVNIDGKIVGVANIGQGFKSDRYFWDRPSSAGNGYDGTKSAGSNKATTNTEYLKEVEARIDTFLVYHSYLTRQEVPAEMVTASGSGLDPDISPQSAYIQIKRIAKARNIPELTIRHLVDSLIEPPLLYIFGPSKINVLKLNAALDTL